MSIVGGGTEVSRIATYERRGQAYLKKVDKALRQFLVPNAPKLKFFDAVDWYHRAAKAFMVATEWQDAAEAFAKASDMCAHMGMAHEAAVFSLKAAENMTKVRHGARG